MVVLSLLAPASVAGATPIHSGKIAIGDSVMLGAKPQLLARGFVRVDAVVSRQFYSAPMVINQWKNRGLLPHTVVVHLGTNGLIHGSDCDATVHAVGPRQIYFVTLKVPRPHRDPSNAALRACVNRHGNAHLIDWFTYSRLHTSWFYHDGYHLNPVGRIKYAMFVASHSG